MTSSPSRYSRPRLFITFISFRTRKYTPPPLRSFLERFMLLYLVISYKSCWYLPRQIAVRARDANPSFEDFMYVSRSVNCFGRNLTSTYKLDFSPIALHMGITLKSQYFFVVGARPFPSNQNVNECFHCAFQIFHNLYQPCIHMP